MKVLLCIILFFIISMPLYVIAAENYIDMTETLPTISWLRIIQDPEQFDQKQIILIAPVENWQVKHNTDGNIYYELDIYRDITAIFNSDKLPKDLQKQDMLRMQGTFHSIKIYKETLYNNLLVIDKLKRLDTN